MNKSNFDMKISFAVLMSAMGMLGLVLLSSTQWARENVSSNNLLFQFFLGVSPNIAAGYAMPLILASFTPKVVKNENRIEARKIYLLISAFTTFGLIAWEFIQLNSKNLYFDTNDIVATFIGTFLAYISYLWLSKLKIPNEQGNADQPSVSDLRNTDQFQLLLELGHKDLIPFVNEHYWKRKSWVTILHYLFSFTILVIWFWIGFQERYSFDEWFSRFGFAVLSFFVLLPIHELIHALVYKIAGAKDIRFGASLRQAYAYAIAHYFVANRLVFTWVAIAPFIVINSILVLGAIFLQQHAFYLIGVLLLHTAGTSGDFAMLNYLWVNRHQEIYTFDDAVENKTYFYSHVESQN